MIYSDIVNNDLLLPEKKKYTKKDFYQLVNAGTIPKVARFICICSAVYYDTKYSVFFDSVKCKYLCNIL